MSKNGMLSGEQQESKIIVYSKNVLRETLTMAKKNRAAVQLGRLGGTATAKKKTPEQRAQQARKAAQARWAKDKKL